MMGKIHTIKQAVKRPKRNEVKLFIKSKSRPNLLKIVKRITTTTTGLHFPGLGQPHKVCGRFKHVFECSTFSNLEKCQKDTIKRTIKFVEFGFNSSDRYRIQTI